MLTVTKLYSSDKQGKSNRSRERRRMRVIMKMARMNSQQGRGSKNTPTGGWFQQKPRQQTSPQLQSGRKFDKLFKRKCTTESFPKLRQSEPSPEFLNNWDSHHKWIIFLPFYRDPTRLSGLHPPSQTLFLGPSPDPGVWKRERLGESRKLISPLELHVGCFEFWSCLQQKKMWATTRAVRHFLTPKW